MIAAMAWQGFLLTLPHDHGQDGVPRYETGCTLVGTDLPYHHLHRLPRPQPPHWCLACLAGHALPLFRGGVTYSLPTPAVRVAIGPASHLVLRTGTVLPHRRGPPASA